jgi:hypothetical protein
MISEYSYGKNWFVMISAASVNDRRENEEASVRIHDLVVKI